MLGDLECGHRGVTRRIALRFPIPSRTIEIVQNTRAEGVYALGTPALQASSVDSDTPSARSLST